MASVTSRINQITQPRGGYINPKSMKKVILDNATMLNDISSENVPASLVGTAVDYLTRFLLCNDVYKSFKISALGASLIGEENKCLALLNKIKDLDDESIKSALKAVGYDVCFRAGPDKYKPVSDIQPNKNTIENVKTMVLRALSFFKKYGPVVLEGFTFEGAYTSLISSGDGDFITKDVLWDFKVSNNEPTSKHTLQLLIYLLMGKKSIHKEFDNIRQIGIFNPRLNAVYLFDISTLPDDVIKEVETYVIGYDDETKSNITNVVDKQSLTSRGLLSNEARFLEKYIKRDFDKAETALLKFGPKSGNIEEKQFKETVEKAKQGDEQSIALTAYYYVALANDGESLSWDYPLTIQLIIEAVCLAEKLYKVDPRIGSFILSDIYDNCPAILTLDGKEDMDADAKISKLRMKYLKEAWEKYDFIDAGERYAAWLLMPFIEEYNPKKAIDILKKLEKEHEDELSPNFFTTYGAEYLSGEHISRDVDKAKKMFQKAYEKGDSEALDQMNRLMKKYKISSKNYSNTESCSKQLPSYATGQQGGCYIATCVYGSYDCPEVWRLRRYRDYYLKNKWWGRLFIKLYYFISPKLVSTFGKRSRFLRFWKRFLDKKLLLLEKEGYSDEPYSD